jgi:hypothetical protein
MNEPELIRKVLAALLEGGEDRSTLNASEILDALRPHLDERELAYLVLCGIDDLTNKATLATSKFDSPARQAPTLMPDVRPERGVMKRRQSASTG